MTKTSIPPDLTIISATSKACSPVSGWDRSKSSIFTPIFSAYIGSNACSASINAAVPPCFWHSAITCKVRVVFPEDSGPKISTTLPFGKPIIPSAKSNPSEPVEILGML